MGRRTVGAHATITIATTTARNECTSVRPASFTSDRLWGARSSRAIVGIKHLPPTSHLEQQLGGRRTFQKTRVQILQTLHDDLNTERIHVPEWSSAKWREADS